MKNVIFNSGVGVGHFLAIPTPTPPQNSSDSNSTPKQLRLRVHPKTAPIRTPQPWYYHHIKYLHHSIERCI